MSDTNRKVSVHPRVCGELHADADAGAAVDGSSPRVRGTHVRAVARVRGQRFIPACAGNSTREIVELRGATGSSPRVRGTLDHRDAGDRGRRFIPACAGNSVPPSDGPAPSPVHPRVCGELAAR